jgi:hypothetical protein
MGYHDLVKLGSEEITTSNGEKIRVSTYNGTPPQGKETRVYEIPFSKEVFDAMMKHTKDGQVGLHIQDVVKGRTYVPRSVDEFLAPEDRLEELLKIYEQPKPTNEYNFNLSAQDLADFKRYQLAKEEQGQHQYG